MEVPVLETDHLVLRGFKPDDFEAYAVMRADSEVMRHIGDGKPKSEEEAWAGFLQMVGHWQVAGSGSWAIVEKSSGTVVGSAGFQDRRRDRGVGLKGVPEAGWIFARSVWGKGYATEALQAALTWGRSHFGPVRVIALTTLQNAASIRVAEKCGFRQAGPIVSVGRPRLLLERIF